MLAGHPFPWLPKFQRWCSGFYLRRDNASGLEFHPPEARIVVAILCYLKEHSFCRSLQWLFTSINNSDLAAK
jgi:hypothetical protein